MDRQIIVLIADKRQEKIAKFLEGEKISYAWNEAAGEKEECEKIYILPTPLSKLDQRMEMKEKLKRELINLSVNGAANIKVFGGVINQEWKAFFEQYKIPYWDFMKLPEVVEGNGWITAEATIAEILLQSELSIYGQKIIVTGYGCCGEKIAKLLGKLGAKIIVAARRKEVRERIEKDGFEAISLEDMAKYMVDVSTVVNTVPALVVTEQCIRHMMPESLIIDIASKPGGTDFEAAKKYGVKAKLALGLPGIYTTSSSAMIFKNAISKYASLQECVKGDKVWIFQIII